MRNVDDRSNDTDVFISAAAFWAPLRPSIAGEARLAQAAAQKRWTASIYEFLRFGVK
jgi:hypothetical protein